MTCFICNDAIVQPNNSSFIRQTPLIMLIVCVCPHSFNAKDIRGERKKARGKIVALVNVITIACWYCTTNIKRGKTKKSFKQQP